MYNLSLDILLKLIQTNEVYYKQKIHNMENTILKLKLHIINDIKQLYLKRFNRDDYLEWLDNDIVRWLNNDIGTIYSIDDKLKSYISRLKEITIEDYINGNISSPIIIDLIFQHITIDELLELKSFLLNIFDNPEHNTITVPLDNIGTIHNEDMISV